MTTIAFNHIISENQNVELILYQDKKVFYLFFLQFITSQPFPQTSQSWNIHQFQFPKGIYFNSSFLQKSHQWYKWGNVNENIGIFCCPNERTHTLYHIRQSMILLPLLVCLNIIALFYYQPVNIFSTGIPLHSRVNLVHFKAAHLGPSETYMMKFTS